jgi:hypothetical protein
MWDKDSSLRATGSFNGDTWMPDQREILSKSYLQGKTVPVLQMRNINGHNYAIRQLVYGLDLVEIEFERKFVGGQRPRVIQCIGVDTGSDQRGKDKLVEVFYPEDVYKKLIASKQQPKTGDGTKGAPSGQLSENEVYRYPVPGIVDKKQLKQIAEASPYPSPARMDDAFQRAAPDVAR